MLLLIISAEDSPLYSPLGQSLQFPGVSPVVLQQHDTWWRALRHHHLSRTDRIETRDRELESLLRRAKVELKVDIGAYSSA